MTGVNEIGLKSVLASLTGTILGEGMTSADFHILGKQASSMEALKIEQSERLRMFEKSLRIQFGKSSGPTALQDLT